MSKKQQISRSAVPGITGAARAARAQDAKVRKEHKIAFSDSFVNFAAKLGIGTDNLSSFASYGFNPLSRQRTILEWMHRGSWIAGMIVDIVADDMTREGVELQGQLKPDLIEKLEEEAVRLQIWNKLNQTIKWARLYGGCIAVLLVAGQDSSTPFNLETVGPGQFYGILPLDRWMVEPDLSRRVRDIGPRLGEPMYYKVVATAPALVGATVHYTRCIRLLGTELPYWQAMMENLWGISVLERVYDRMVGFDSATQGIAQLIYKAYLRTLKVAGLRDIVATGTDSQLGGLARYVDMARKFQTVEGFTLIDGEDEFGEHTGATSTFSGISEAGLFIGQQLAGASEIPLVRLFGQAPIGMNSTGESDLKTYYDGIRKRQVSTCGTGVPIIYRCMAQSMSIILPPGFKTNFRPLWQSTNLEKSDIAGKVADALDKVYATGNVSPKFYLQELRQSSAVTGYFSNITDEDIESAEEVPPPAPIELEAGSDEPALPGGEDDGAHSVGDARRRAVVRDWNEQQHPRVQGGAHGGEFTASGVGGGNSRKVVRSSDLIKKQPSGMVEYAGVHENDWASWASDPETYQEILNGETPSMHGGKSLSSEEINHMRKVARNIEYAANTHAVIQTSLFRGESFDSEQELFARYKQGVKVTTEKLTSTSTEKESVLPYAFEGQGSIPVVIIFGNPNGHKGVQTAPMGVPSNEVIMPNGQQYRVSRITKSGTGYYIDLYSTEKHKNVTKVDASSPALIRDSFRSVVGLAWNHGLHAVIETPKGTKRRGNGWEVMMPVDYGYIRATEGADGDQVDCFIGPSPESPHVFVINQVDPVTKQFDEHKCMFGYYAQDSAVEDYFVAHQPGMAQKKFQSVVPMSMQEFKTWLASGKLNQPARVERVQ